MQRGGSQGAVAPEEAAIEMSKSQETLKLHSGCGFGTILHRSHPVRIHLNVPCSNDVTHNIDSGAIELTFHSFNKQLRLRETLKD